MTKLHIAFTKSPFLFPDRIGTCVLVYAALGIFHLIVTEVRLWQAVRLRNRQLAALEAEFFSEV